MTEKKLIEKAVLAMNNSYSPYSGFRVGAALLCQNGNIYIGTNVENASYSATICAERSAISGAISNGETKFSAMAIVGGKNGEINDYCYPCGICRQVINEFCDKDFKIILTNGSTVKTLSLNELLPHSFGRDTLC